ncbi:MAG: phenylalanine--tRNA ligase subunit beta, partial [Bdellovibrionales bacterium]|nr:phenylalanine--tRNA ligase subunit beta [Bdellovibrionales bacterium]
MKFPLSWLQSYFSQDLESEKVIDAFFSVGLEVDQVIELGKDLDLVIKAKVESFVSHPDADSLSLCQVNTGQEVLSIVCGAKNFVAGDFVALAMIGAKLPNGLKIKKSKIRGQESFGMLCSESELGLAETSEGILIIPADDQNPLGEPIAKVLGLEDIQIELELTPNRGDCLSIEGLVREVAASLELSSKIQGSESRGENNHSIEVEIEEPEACPRYSLHRLSDIAVQSSTSLVQRRLERCGVRSIDHVVDITNYVMLEMGQPMHAFDADKVIGGIRVRYAKEGENLLCLDDIERVLDPADLIIADDEGPLALAGVMGGQRSSVDQNTKNILLESAHFDPSVVRLSSKRHHISTESSRRFERVVDPCLSWSAASRAVEMLIEYGAKVEKKIDVIKGEFQAREIFLRKSKIQKILGADLEDAGQILSRLGFSLSKMDEGWMVRVP